MPIRKKYITPRQKMINLLYVILMAMLAINVTSGVIKGYDVLTDSMGETAEKAERDNLTVLGELESLYRNNPVKTAKAIGKAREIHCIADSLCSRIEYIKRVMVTRADGKFVSFGMTVNKDDMEAPYRVMVTDRQGEELARGLAQLQKSVASVTGEGNPFFHVSDLTSHDRKEWERTLSEMPLAGALALLAKVQNDIRQEEGKALVSILEGVDYRDLRTNRLRAFVIPEARSIVRGDRFRATVVLAAVDSTMMPEVWIDGTDRKAAGNSVEMNAGLTGRHTLSGKIVATDRHGKRTEVPFRETYEVVEPMSSITSRLMNVLYAGYDNTVDVSAYAVRPSEMRIDAAGCSVRNEGNARFSVRPSGSLVGKETDIKVTGVTESGRHVEFSHRFRVRALPMPIPYVMTPGGKFSGGKINRGTLMASGKVGAGIDDGILDVTYKVLSFDMVFFDNLGNAKVFPSTNDRMTEEQKRMAATARRNSRCYVSSVRVKGPDGVTRTLKSSMEIILR